MFISELTKKIFKNPEKMAFRCIGVEAYHYFRARSYEDARRIVIENEWLPEDSTDAVIRTLLTPMTPDMDDKFPCGIYIAPDGIHFGEKSVNVPVLFERFPNADFVADVYAANDCVVIKAYDTYYGKSDNLAYAVDSYHHTGHRRVFQR